MDRLAAPGSPPAALSFSSPPPWGYLLTSPPACRFSLSSAGCPPINPSPSLTPSTFWIAPMRALLCCLAVYTMKFSVCPRLQITRHEGHQMTEHACRTPTDGSTRHPKLCTLWSSQCAPGCTQRTRATAIAVRASGQARTAIKHGYLCARKSTCHSAPELAYHSVCEYRERNAQWYLLFRTERYSSHVLHATPCVRKCTYHSAC